MMYFNPLTIETIFHARLVSSIRNCLRLQQTLFIEMEMEMRNKSNIIGIFIGEPSWYGFDKILIGYHMHQIPSDFCFFGNKFITKYIWLLDRLKDWIILKHSHRYSQIKIETLITNKWLNKLLLSLKTINKTVFVKIYTLSKVLTKILNFWT